MTILKWDPSRSQDTKEVLDLLEGIVCTETESEVLFSFLSPEVPARFATLCFISLSCFKTRVGLERKAKGEVPDYGCECRLLLQEAGKGVLQQEFLVMGVAVHASCTLMPHGRV